MNRRVIRKVRNAIAAAPDEHFDMRHWSCGTSACIGGFADQVCGLPETSAWTDTAKALGLSEEDAHELFFMHVTSVMFSDVTREGAVRVLNHLLKTGEVDWSIIDTPHAA